MLNRVHGAQWGCGPAIMAPTHVEALGERLIPVISKLQEILLGVRRLHDLHGCRTGERKFAASSPSRSRTAASCGRAAVIGTNSYYQPSHALVLRARCRRTCPRTATSICRKWQWWEARAVENPACWSRWCGAAGDVALGVVANVTTASAHARASAAHSQSTSPSFEHSPASFFLPLGRQRLASRTLRAPSSTGSSGAVAHSSS